jgi:hypothetical protein
MLPSDPLFHKPKSIIAAKNILYATLFLGVINWTISQMTSNVDDNLRIHGLIIAIVALLVIFLLIKQIGLGRQWAKWVLLVFFILRLLSFPFVLVPLFKVNLLVGVIMVFQALLELLALLFLFSTESTHWFNHVQTFVDDEPVQKSKQ